MNILNPYGYDEVFASPVRSRSSFLFDLTAAKPAAAFSLDRLNPDFTGEVLKVRRSIDNDETGIGFAGNGLDVGGLEAFAGAGDAFVTQWYDQRVSNSESVLLPDNSASTYATADNTVDNGDISGKKISFSTVIEAIPIGSQGIVGVTDSDGYRFDVYFQNDNQIRVFQKDSANLQSKFWEIPLGLTLTVGETYDIEVTYGTDGNAPTNVSINGNSLTVPVSKTSSVSQSATTSKFYLHTIGASVGDSSFAGINPLYDLKVFETDETTIQHSWKLNNEGDGFVDTISQKPFSVQQGSYSRVDKSDTSVIGNDAVQTTAASQPRIVKDGVVEKEGGKPVLEFDGVDDYLESSYPTTIAQPSTYFVVGKLENDSDSFQRITEGVDSNNRNIIGARDLGDTWQFSAGTEVATEPANNNQNVFSGLFNGANSSLKINGNDIYTSVDVGTQGTNGIKMSANFDNSFFTNSRIQELIHYPNDQSANREAIEADIMKRYNI